MHLTLSVLGYQINDKYWGGVLRARIGLTPARCDLEGWIPNFFVIYIFKYILLTRIPPKKQKSKKKRPRTQNSKFSSRFGKNSLISRKCPPIGQISIFWGLVFCIHPYLYNTDRLYNNKHKFVHTYLRR